MGIHCNMFSEIMEMIIEPDVKLQVTTTMQKAQAKNLAHNIHVLKTIIYPAKSHLLTRRNFIKQNETSLQRHRDMFKLWPTLENQSARLISLHPMNTGFSTETKNTLVKMETYQLAMESMPESGINYLHSLNPLDTPNTHELCRNINSMY